jgi:surface protein
MMDWTELPQELLLDSIPLGCSTLIEKKRVCRDWNQLCTDAIDAQRTEETTKKAFTTEQERELDVKKYCGHIVRSRYSQRCSQEDAEEFATTYGWPMNKWDVSNNQDFSYIFSVNLGFNEDIVLWNTSNATSMNSMFFAAKAFNQDLSYWDVSNVRNMS